MHLSLIFLVLCVIFVNEQINGNSITRKKRDEPTAEEKEIFDLWMKELEQSMDADFQEFIKEVEKAALTGEEKNLKKSQTRELMSQNTVDKFQELMASVRKDITDEFWKMMKEIEEEMQRAMDGFMATMEKQMDDSFDEFWRWITAADAADSSRGLSSMSFQTVVMEWKSEQVRHAYARFQQFQGRRRRF